MRIFLAGIMQGSRADQLIDDQRYRTRITETLLQHVEGVSIIDPFANHPDSVGYDTEQARATFEEHTALAAEADVLIAYLPTASMGTAIEMWTAYQAGAYILAVTPFKHNWVINVTANDVLPNLDVLLAEIADGRFVIRVNGHARRGTPRRLLA